MNILYYYIASVKILLHNSIIILQFYCKINNNMIYLYKDKYNVINLVDFNNILGVKNV